MNNLNNGGLLDDEFLLRQCFLSYYVLETIKNNGLTSFDKVDFEQKSGGSNFGWALGSAFVQSKLIKGMPVSQLLQMAGTIDNTYYPSTQNSKALKTIVFLVNL